MSSQLTEQEKEKIRKLCFSNPAKGCAFAQEIIDALGIMSCKTYAEIKEKSPRTIQYQAPKLKHIQIEKRKFISLIQ